MSKKEINIYYKGIKQRIKYYGKFDEKAVKSTIKQIFKINEPIEQIYFQDEDGDILILNEEIPSGISIYIYIEPNSIPENPSKELKIKNNNMNLIKFHWIPQYANDSCITNDLNVIKDKYIYTTINDDDIHPPVRSSCTFEKGIHFCVLRKPYLSYYTMIGVVDENVSSPIERSSGIGIFDGYSEESYSAFTENLGILIDMDNKKCIFYDYDRKIRKKIMYKKQNIKE